MKTSPFFEGVTHAEVPWRDRTVWSPTFYYDVRTLAAQFLVPLSRLRALLPSRRLYPLRITPWHGVIDISVYEYRATDIGPYNEVSIGIPVTLDRPSPAFIGTLRPIPLELDAYIHHLPVTSEIARDLGIDVAAYPKFLADIEIHEQGEWVSCRLGEAGHHILTLAVRKGTTRPAPRSRIHIITPRAGRLLSCLAILSEKELSVSRSGGDARLELGEHRIAQELRNLPLGRLVESTYTPHVQTILTPVLETFAA